MKHNYQSVYVAFDPYPSSKGSFIHIHHASNVLHQKAGKTLLLTLAAQTWKPAKGPVKHKTFKGKEPNLLKRASQFSQWVDDTLNQQFQLKVGHFRDIWGGLPILARPHIQSVFEVNGFPSIELPYRYNAIGKGTLEKIRELENECLLKSDQIVCPSETIKAHIVTRIGQEGKITVVPNGATVASFLKKPKSLPANYVVYFGALQPWQGIETIIKAMQYLADKPEIKLVICSSHKEKHARVYQKLVRKLNLEAQVIWRHKLSKQQLFRIVQHAKASLIPLTECSRNLEQGCSPLKIFESMACKVPMIASDLPVVREILKPNEMVKLVRADRPAEFARAIRLLVDYPDYATGLAENAYHALNESFTWEKSNQKLACLYDKFLSLSIT